MTPARDPRVEPRPGDILLVEAIPGNVTPSRGGFRREVTAVRHKHHRLIVEWAVGQFGYECSRVEWRRLNKDAEVLHASK